AASRVSHRVAEGNVFRVPAVAVICFSTKRRNLELMAAFDDDHYPEFAPDGDGVFEKFFDLFRQRGRGDVVIAWLAAQQIIAHAAADPEGGVARGVEAANNVGRPIAG